MAARFSRSERLLPGVFDTARTALEFWDILGNARNGYSW